MRNLALLIALAVFALPASANPPFQPGEWETTIQMQMQGGMHMPAFKTRQCVTAKDLVPKTEQPGQECRVLNQKTEGSTVSWEAQCSGKNGSVHGRGNVVYAKDSYHGTMNMVMNVQGRSMTMNYTLSGRRLGECKQ